MPFLKVKHSHESVLSLCKLTWRFIYLTLSASTVFFLFVDLKYTTSAQVQE